MKNKFYNRFDNVQFYRAQTNENACTNDNLYNVVARRTWKGWTQWCMADWDMAVCELDRDTQPSVGWLKFRNAEGVSLQENDRIYVKGYPQGEPHEKPANTMWVTTGTVWQETSQELNKES